MFRMRGTVRTHWLPILAAGFCASACATRTDTHTSASSQDQLGAIVPAQVPAIRGWDVYPVAPTTPLPPVPVQLAVPALVQGELRTGDMVLPGDSGRVGDHYILHLTEGQPVTLVARGGLQVGSPGSSLDMMLFLYDQNHALILSDDDSASNGSALNPRIVYTPTHTGVYVLRVTSYGGDFRQAPYVLQTYEGALESQL